MEINATLLGQTLTFIALIWFTMRFVWPPVTKAMQERQHKIADGLAAAERGQRDLAAAETKASALLQEAKLTAASIVEQANKQTVKLIEEAKELARQEGERIISHAQQEIAQKANQAQRQLQKESALLALTIAEKILQREVDAKAYQVLFEQMVSEV